MADYQADGESLSLFCFCVGLKKVNGFDFDIYLELKTHCLSSEFST